ncbi:MAG: hypothetical protein ABIK28_08950 [Planctomycetota bacterium]
MKPGMTKIKFEALVARLFGSLLRVKDAPSLLHVACWLLNGESVILVRRESNGNRKLIAVHPEKQSKWVNENLDSLCTWTGDDSLIPKIPGHANEDTLTIRDRSFPDALIAYGGTLTRTQPPAHELVVLQKPEAGERYCSYHCSVAGALLRYYENLKLYDEILERKKEKEKEQDAKKRYAGALSHKMLFNEPWNEFVKRIEDEKCPNEIKNPDFMGAAAVIWTGYRKRPQDEMKGKPGFDPDTAGRLCDKSEQLARESIYSKSLDFLLKGSFLPHHFAEQLINHCTQDEDHRNTALIILEHSWRRILLSNFEWESENYPNSTDNRNPANHSVPYNETILDAESINALIKLTSVLVTEGFATEENIHRKAYEGEGGPLRIDRNFLRLYLASLLAGSGELRKRYLKLDGSNDPLEVPNEVGREFLLNLARFTLSVIEILENKWEIETQSSAVSKMEVLDSLLYLVDRYAHVQLGVDERIHIREHLARGFASEVKRHLNQPFYRDHLIHVIDVFLVGHLLLHTSLPRVAPEKNPLKELLSNIFKKDKGDENGSQEDTQKWLRDWAVAALLHDIGYQLGQGSDKTFENDLMNHYFALHGKDVPHSLNLEKFDKNIFDDFITKLIQRFLPQNEVEEEERWLPSPGIFSVEDHGVLSALRIAQVLANAASIGLPGNDDVDMTLVSDYHRALHAMAYHNLFNHKVRFSSHPLTCLLRLVDELQEWNRRRVNIERIVKHLYLKIEDMDTEVLSAYESLKYIETNLLIKCIPTNTHNEVKIVLPGENPHFLFQMKFEDPIKAHFDATTTFLSKAYNLQHVELTTPDTNIIGHIEWRMELAFPQPDEYRGLTELDIYGKFKHSRRSLPFLPSYTDITVAGGGLSSLKRMRPWDSKEKPYFHHDILGIVVKDHADSKNRKAWISCNPADFFKEFIEFKSEMLINRALGRSIYKAIRPHQNERFLI